MRAAPEEENAGRFCLLALVFCVAKAQFCTHFRGSHSTFRIRRLHVSNFSSSRLRGPTSRTQEQQPAASATTATMRHLKMSGYHRHHQHKLRAAIVVILCCIAFQDQIKPLLTDGAVVRPTIFSDLPPDAQTTNNLAPAQQPGQQQQQNSGNKQAPQQQLQQPTQPQANLPVHALVNNANINQHQHTHLNNQHANNNNNHHWQQHQQDGPQTQKINPLKSRFCTGPNNLRQDHALGLQSGVIDDLSLSASSFSNEQVGPHLARLNQNILGGAWCPMKPISAGTFGHEWIQVKFNKSYVISAIETQGRFALGSGKEFVPSYQIIYSRNNGLTWHKWKDFRGSSLLRANEDVNTAVRNELSPPIVGANVIRILPYSQYLRTVCLRLELYGCQYDEGAPVSYSTNDGVIEPRWGYLVDYTYDGLKHRGQLSGGLGQLVDGVKGPDNFSFNNGFEWVGWKSMNGDVVIEFTFKTLRNFTGALFHSNNLFSSGVEVFQSVDVHYGIDINLSMEALKDSLQEQKRRQLQSSDALSRSARQSSEPDNGSNFSGSISSQHHSSTVWSSDVLSIEYEPDKKAESSRPVTVHLKQRLANKLRFVLKFASKWILISEVEFLSHPVELMSLASLNEQLTPQLMSELKAAKTYDQYVAILREHQLRRIAAEEYMSGALGSTTGSQMITTPTTTPSANLAPSTAGVLTGSTESPPMNDQISEQQPGGNMKTGDDLSPLDTDSTPIFRVPNQPVWPGESAPNVGGTGPATNPLFGSQLPYPPRTNLLVPNFPDQQEMRERSGVTNDKIEASDQQQPRARTIGLATVISFVFVGIIGLVGLLFAISSYRLRCRSPKLGSPTALPRHLHNGGAGTSRKGFMGSVFAPSAGSSSSSGDSTSTGSLHHTNNQYHRNHMTMANQHNHHAYQQQQQLQGHQQQRSDSHYNPLFASASGRSSEGSLKKPANGNGGGGGPLSTLKKLAAFTTNSANNSPAKHDLLFGQIPQNIQQQSQQQNQLLVSLKDSISSGGKCKSSGKSQAISTQLIVGLNQANPLAHQQIYNHHQQQAIYGIQQHQQSSNNPYNSTVNSMSLTSSSTFNGAPTNQQTGVEYSLTASADYATPDIQSNTAQLGNQQQQHPNYQHNQLMGPPAGPRQAFANGDVFRSSTRGVAANPNRLAHIAVNLSSSQMEHNYEQINGELVSNGELCFDSVANTMHHQHHQKTLSGNQQQPVGSLACGQQAFNSMTLNNGSFAASSRTARQHQQQRQQQQQQGTDSSHYYYADTEASKSCLGKQ